MTENEIAMAAIVREHLGVDLDAQATGLATTLEAIGADSLDIIELAMAVEDHFQVTLTDDELADFSPGEPKQKTIADLLALVEGKKGAGNGR